MADIHRQSRRRMSRRRRRPWGRVCTAGFSSGYPVIHRGSCWFSPLWDGLTPWTDVHGTDPVAWDMMVVRSGVYPKLGMGWSSTSHLRNITGPIVRANRAVGGQTVEINHGHYDPMWMAREIPRTIFWSPMEQNPGRPSPPLRCRGRGAL